MKPHTLRLLTVLLAAAFVVTELQWARAIGWDEVELFRATRWVAEGRVPFRDFWEHHLPLQWYLFAPVAALADGPGVASILILRWAQLPLWVAVFWFLFALLRRAGVGTDRALGGLLLAVGSLLLIESMVEYRLDTPAAACWLGALLLVVARPRARGAWMAFGALMSAAVLANMRLAPLVVATGALLLFLRIDERRWRWNGVALWMAPGVALVAAAFGAWLMATGTFDALLEAMRHNAMFVRASGETFTGTLLLPFTRPDPGVFVLLAAGAAGVVAALRGIRTPGILQLLAILAIAALALMSGQGVLYAYHFQIPLLLFAALAGGVVPERWSIPAAALLIAAGLVRLLPIGESMAYKDAVLREVDRRTAPGERVWDGAGYALRREPAYRYWFLPVLVQMLAARGEIEPYDAPQMMAAPPAAIVHSYRVNVWLRMFPRAGAYATHHYLPLYRDLWIPGLSAAVGAGGEAAWIAPRAGRYRLYASDLLLKHPWFNAPLKYAMFDGDDAPLFEVRLRELPVTPTPNVTVDGLPAGPTLILKRGSVVRLRSDRRTAVVIVPEDVSTLFVCPPSPGWM